jgi:hypothetical protein
MMTEQKEPERKRGRPRSRFEPDVRITVRLRPGRDDDLLTWLADLPARQKAKTIRQALRQHLRAGQKQSQG